MSNTRLTANLACGLTLELDNFVTGVGGSTPTTRYELEIEALAVDSAMRDEHIRLLFQVLNIPVVSPAGYPPKMVLAMIDAGAINEKHKRWEQWKKAQEEARDLLSG